MPKREVTFNCMFPRAGARPRVYERQGVCDLSAGEILKQMLERLRVANLVDGRTVIPRLRILAKRRKLYFDFLHVKNCLQ